MTSCRVSSKRRKAVGTALISPRKSAASGAVGGTPRTAKETFTTCWSFHSTLFLVEVAVWTYLPVARCSFPRFYLLS